MCDFDALWVQKVLCESLFAFVVRRQFVCVHGSGCGYENARYHVGFVSAVNVSVCVMLVGSFLTGEEDPWSRTIVLIVSPIPQSTALCPPFSPQPVNTSLCPSLSIDKSLRSNAFLYCCQSIWEYDFVFFSFDTCIAFTHIHCSHLGVFISAELIWVTLNYSIWCNLGFKWKITSSKCCFGGGPVHLLSVWRSLLLGRSMASVHWHQHLLYLWQVQLASICLSHLTSYSFDVATCHGLGVSMACSKQA